MPARQRLICGVGVSDASYNVTVSDNGKIIWQCPIYSHWKSMIYRCYNEKQLKKRPSYFGTTVSEEWLTFSNFEKWFRPRYFSGCNLEKDLKVFKNKQYSSETCLVVDAVVNGFLLGIFAKSNNPKGVQHYPSRGLKCYKAQINNGNGTEWLGWFYSKESAHLAWQKAKVARALHLASNQECVEVKKHLTLFAEKIMLDILENKETIF